MIQLRSLHRVLIMSAIGLGVLFAASAVHRYSNGGQPAALATAVVTLAATASLVVYLRWFNRKS